MMRLIISFGGCILLKRCTGIESSTTVRANKSEPRGVLVPVSVGGQTLVMDFDTAKLGNR
jgi:hypothetical protein